MRLTPQARGWTLRLPKGDRRSHAYPAGAGMDLHPDIHRVVVDRLPRRRGDGPHIEEMAFLGDELTPQARGWTADRHAQGLQVQAYPAGAGMDPTSRRWLFSVTSLPRRRGDGPQIGMRKVYKSKLTPQARGWTQHQLRRNLRALAYPAGAGMDLAQR